MDARSSIQASGFPAALLILQDGPTVSYMGRLEETHDLRGIGAAENRPLATRP